jgi:hypothetical protein
MQEFFNGTLRANGIAKDWSEKVIRYFDASIDASWEDGVGKLDENVVFDDGEEQWRIWTIVKDELKIYLYSKRRDWQLTVKSGR